MMGCGKRIMDGTKRLTKDFGYVLGILASGHVFGFLRFGFLVFFCLGLETRESIFGFLDIQLLSCT